MKNIHSEFANGLRAIADLYERNPEIPLPDTYCIPNYVVDTKADAVMVARALGACKKDYSNDFLTLSKKFGPVVATFIFTRSSVCVRKVVGTKLIPEHTVIHPARTEDIVEWECEPILAPSSDGTLSAIPDNVASDVPF